MRIADLESERIADLEDERIADLESERIADLEDERIANLERERIADLEYERIANLERERIANLERERLADLEIMTKTRKLAESTQIRITVKHGLELLKQIQKSNDAKYEDAVSSIIISYLENSTSNDIKFVLKFITFSEKINCLLQLIELRYQGNTDSDMKEGSRLYKLFNP